MVIIAEASGTVCMAIIVGLRYTYPHVGVWRSLVARTVRDGEVVCSNHITPTKIHTYVSMDILFTDARLALS